MPALLFGSGFDRTIDGEMHEFGVSGFFRHSDLVRFDRKTETLWQQSTGKAIVGDYVGRTLKQLPSLIIPFEKFRESYPDGKVLSRDTGYNRNYGENPYTGYDDMNNTPLLIIHTDGAASAMDAARGISLTAQDFPAW